MTNLTATTAPTTATSARHVPRSIRTARGLWTAVSACAALVSITSLVMLVGSLIGGATVTAAGVGLISTGLTVLLAAAISWITFTTGKQLRSGDAHARRVLACLAAALLVVSIFPGAVSVLGGVTTVLALAAAACSFLPSASRFLHPRRTNA